MKSAHCIVKINKEKRKLYYVNDKTKKQNKIYMGKTGGLYILSKKDNKISEEGVEIKANEKYKRIKEVI